ncbi:endogenous retrovirus group MER34 member 1, partial [Chelydra serpentina]
MNVYSGILLPHSSLEKISGCPKHLGTLTGFISGGGAVTYWGGILNNTHALGGGGVSHWRCQDQMLSNSKHGGGDQVAESTLTLYLETPGGGGVCGHSTYKALPPGWRGGGGVARVIPNVQINKTLNSGGGVNLGSYSHRLF